MFKLTSKNYLSISSNDVNLGFSKPVGMYKFLRVIVFLLPMSLFAQDIHFSQFYMSPLNLNPALTGVMNCKMRFIANYRNQWAPILKTNAFNTFNASFDQKIPVSRYDYFGFGGTIWGDKAGSLDFKTVSFKLSGSYAKRMSGSRTSANYLVFGLDGSLNTRSINFHNAIWGSQITSNGPDVINRPPDPTAYDPSFLFADVSVGLLWFSVLDKKNNFYFGGAYSHLNEPLQNHAKNIGGNNFTAAPLFPKLTAHAGGTFQMGYKNSLVPGIVTFKQGPHWQVNGGASVRFNLVQTKSDEQSFQLGLWTRLANSEKTINGTDVKKGILMDAIILSTRFDYNKMGFGLSYDINTSSLRNASPANNSFELSFIYNICGPEKRGIYCPNF
ncbi:MAG: PorP/SprF family type IX secretion system membrane protein [Saprospiraceae bacterium]|nr:PorP/SprF family type IX secretion system membrane protein [Saprospiraceae bacterium]